MTMLRVEGLTKNFGELCAVDRCSFEVGQGTIQGLIGPNGSGKTTVFNLITGFLRSTAGKTFFKDREITGLPAARDRPGRHRAHLPVGARVPAHDRTGESAQRAERAAWRAHLAGRPANAASAPGENASSSTGRGIC